MIYIRLRNRQESGFRNYFFTHERLASQYSLLFSRRKTSTFWSNSIRQLTRLLPRIERLRFGQIAESEMHNLTCAACGRALAETSAWKGSSEFFYCNDFWAEAEKTDINPIRYAVSTKSPEHLAR